MTPDNLNLLPEDLQVSRGLASTLKTIRSLGVILIVCFSIFCVGMVGFFIFSKISLDNANTNMNQLKTQVAALEASEQQLILLKDRLGKISSIKKEPSATKNVASLNSMINNSSPTMKMSEVSITPSEVSMRLDIYSNEDLTTFLQYLRNSTLFDEVELSTFNYTQNKYSLDVGLNQIAVQ